MSRTCRIQIAASILFVALAQAQDVSRNDEWSSLRSLPPEAQVNVLLKDRKFLQGRVVGWSPGKLDVALKRQVRTLHPAEVQRVAVQQRTSRWRGVMFGALTGFCIGFPIGAAWTGHLTDRNDPGVATRIGMGAGLGMFGAGIGAPLGALFGGRKSVTVYRAKPEQP